MALFAHARIVDPENPDKIWDRGDEVAPKDAERLGLDPEYGAISREEYDPAADVSPPPDVIEIDGVRYTKEKED